MNWLKKEIRIPLFTIKFSTTSKKIKIHKVEIPLKNVFTPKKKQADKND